MYAFFEVRSIYVKVIIYIYTDISMVTIVIYTLVTFRIYISYPNLQ